VNGSARCSSCPGIAACALAAKTCMRQQFPVTQKMAPPKKHDRGSPRHRPTRQLAAPAEFDRKRPQKAGMPDSAITRRRYGRIAVAKAQFAERLLTVLDRSTFDSDVSSGLIRAGSERRAANRRSVRCPRVWPS